jgi:integrase
LTAARGDRYEGIYVVAVHTGMRQGEILGLRWEDVDLEAGALSIRRSWSMTKDGPLFAPPKTAKSRRSLRLTGATVAALKRHRVRQNEERLALGDEWHDNDLVFPNHHGGPLHSWILCAAFKKVLRRADLPDVRFHDLRHTCATLLFARGVHPKLVQELLGLGACKEVKQLLGSGS